MNDPSSKELIRIVLIGQYNIIQYAFEKLILQQKNKMAVVGNYMDCTEALPHLDSLAPNVIIINPTIEEEKSLGTVFDLIIKTHAKVLIFKWLNSSEIYSRRCTRLSRKRIYLR